MKRLYLLVALISMLCVSCTKDFLDDLKGLIGGSDNKRPDTEDIQIPHNQIWYTNGSTTEPTEPYATDVFGANIVSNTFDAEKEHWVIKFDGDVTTIGEDAFYWCDSLTSVTIPDSVTTIGDRAFSECYSLTSVTIPDSVTTIGGYAFYNCSSLTSITIPDSVTTIEDYAFGSCRSLTSVTIPDSVTSIGTRAFAYCSSLTSVTIPDSVTSIGDEAFSYCSSLTSVYCKAVTPPAGGYYMFDDNASGRKIYVPMESVEAYKSADGWIDHADAIEGYDFE